jgi:acetoin utilization deacetylase AcuC-like enzyme
MISHIHGQGGRMAHYHNQNSTKTTCYLLFDERMALHRPPTSVFKRYPEEETDVLGPCENSSRIIALYRRMMELEDRLVNSNSKLQTAARRFISLNPKFCKRSTLLLAHTERHVENMLRTSTMTNQELDELCEKDNDLYYCRDTFLAASLAAGGVVTACDAVLSAAETGIGPTRAIGTSQTIKMIISFRLLHESKN